jgi:hypothetical protein
MYGDRRILSPDAGKAMGRALRFGRIAAPATGPRIGAGAVVVSDVPPGATVVGVPAASARGHPISARRRSS